MHKILIRCAAALLLNACSPGAPLDRLPLPAAGAVADMPTLTVFLHGNGNVNFSPPLPGCTRSAEQLVCRVPVARVTLVPEPAPDSYFWRWSREQSQGWDCNSSGYCTVAFADPGAPTRAEAHVYFAPKVCNRSRLCWENPLPQGNDLRRAWAAHGQLFAVGRVGTILHFDGSLIASESYEPLGELVAPDLLAVWGTDPDDAWTAGRSGVLLHRSSGLWTRVAADTTEDLYSGWSQSKASAWVVGTHGTVLRFDGRTWTPEHTDSAAMLRGIWGQGAELWAVGEAGTIMHREGALWRSVPSPTRSQLNTIWGSSAQDIWAAGDNTTLLHYDGAAWTVRNDLLEHRFSSTKLHELWGSAADDIWLAAQESVPPPLEWRAAVLHFDGRSWSVQRMENQLPMSGIVGLSPDEIWTVGERGMLMRAQRTSEFLFQSLRHGIEQLLKSVWAAEPDRAIIAGFSGTMIDMRMHPPIEHVYDANLTKLTKSNLNVVAGLAPDDIWIAGDGGAVLHSDGQKWSISVVNDQPVLFGLMPDTRRGARVFAVGQRGALVTLNRDAPSSLIRPVSADLYAVWPDGDEGVWVAGQNSTLRPTSRPPATCGPIPSALLLGVSRRAAETWVVGSAGTILRRIGSSDCFVPVASGTTALLAAIDAPVNDSASALAPWTVGQDGILLTWDGSSWQPRPSGTHQHLNGVSFCDQDEVWLVGDSGTILHRPGAAGRTHCRQAAATP